jgi:hypothetical protein
MLSNGRSKENQHKGTTRVLAGDLEIDGKVFIGDQSVGGTGYILPEVKGTEGQVITMNADNSTSFQDASQGLTGRIIKNLFVMREKTNFYNTLPTSAQALFQTGYGSNVVDIANFPVNSTIHIYSRGVIDFDASVVSSGTGVFQLEVDDGAGNVARFTSNNLTLSKQGTANQNRFYQVDYIFQRTADNSYKFNGYGLVSDGSGGQIKMGYTEQNFVPTIPYTQFTIKGTYYKIVSTPGEEYIPLASVYINNLILDSSLLVDPPPAPTSHTALTDLTAGDAGHTQFALLGGRSGGQVLSGGLTSSNFLTIKSHSASALNNIVVKDLNTSFEKNIDMNNNDIINSNSIQTNQINSVIDLFLSPLNTVVCNSDLVMNDNEIINCNNIRTNVQPILTINKNGSNATEIYGNSTIRRVQISNGVYLLTGTDLFCGNNDIQQCGNLEVSTINNLTPVGGLFSGTSDSLNVSATTAEISILPLTFVGVGFGVPPNGFSNGDCFLLNLSGPFNSNNGDTLTIRLKGGPTSTTLLSTLVVPLNASSASVFQLSVTFQIRNIGGAGVADIVSDADLTYNQSAAGGSFVGEQSLSQNNTTFATDVANILDVTAQFSSNSANNDMTTRVSKLQKTF